MNVSVSFAVVLTFAMGAVILFCRVFPFLFFREKPGQAAFLNFVEKVVPPVAMTVLAFHSVAGPLKADVHEAVPALIAAGITALLHVWKRNSLISIFGGTALYMVLERIIHFSA
jgi:branched-subunit amino acid transport protein AzlD